MASLRKAAAYSKGSKRAFTRTSKRKSKAFIKTVPHNKIVKYNMGNQKDFEEGKHKNVVNFTAEDKIQVRDNALEACRQTIFKVMEKNAQGQFYFTIKVYPHHLLRENKAAAGAGADRLSSGMSHSYGTIIGRSAQVKPGQVIFSVSCSNEKAAKTARDAFSRIKSKIPGKVKVSLEKL